MSIPSILFYSVTLTFIVIHLYGWVIKRFYRPMAYAEHFEQYFPAQRIVSLLYLLQLFEIPYLLNINSGDALLYVNTFSLLLYSLLPMIMCDRYFYPEETSKWRYCLLAATGAIVLFPLLLQAINLINLSESYRICTFYIGTGLFAVNFFLTLRMAHKIGMTLKYLNESGYSDTEDFPERFASYVRWVPVATSIVVGICFYADNQWVKLVKDILFIGTSIWFLMDTLDPWKNLSFTKEEKEIVKESKDSNLWRLSEEKFAELSLHLQNLLDNEMIYTKPHLTAKNLTEELGTNANYLTEVIARIGYNSFYDMINHYRVNYAIELIRMQRENKMYVIAEQCGFSSATSMNKAFKQQNKKSPSQYKVSD